MPIRVLTWNLFHGRDHPPDPALLTWRSRLLRLTERNDTHLQVNRDLFREFAAVLGGAAWDIALLQECPPRWHDELARVCRAQAHGVPTSRNSLPRLRALIARFNPDLVASNEGGSNLTLVRRGRIAERRKLELRPGPRPERRVMAFTRIELGPGAEVCVANLHASAGRALLPLAEEELRLAADRALAWAGGSPVVLGGDLNLRPRDSGVYEELTARYGFSAPASDASLDHLLCRGLDVLEPPRAWEPERREIGLGGRAIRLSDHAPVAGVFARPGTRPDPGDRAG